MNQSHAVRHNDAAVMVDLAAERAAREARAAQERLDVQARIVPRSVGHAPTEQELVAAVDERYPHFTAGWRGEIVDHARVIAEAEAPRHLDATTEPVQRPVDFIPLDLKAAARAQARQASDAENPEPLRGDDPHGEDIEMSRPTILQVRERVEWLAFEVRRAPDADEVELRAAMNKHFGCEVHSAASFRENYLNPAREVAAAASAGEPGVEPPLGARAAGESQVGLAAARPSRTRRAAPSPAPARQTPAPAKHGEGASADLATAPLFAVSPAGAGRVRLHLVLECTPARAAQISGVIANDLEAA